MLLSQNRFKISLEKNGGGNVMNDVGEQKLNESCLFRPRQIDGRMVVDFVIPKRSAEKLGCFVIIEFKVNVHSVNASCQA